MTALLWLVRGAQETGLMALFGSACLLALLRVRVPELALEGGALSFIRRMAALMALVTGPVWFTLAAADMADHGLPDHVLGSERLWQAAMATTFGQMFVLRLVLILALTATVWLGHLRWSALLSGAALVTIAVTSHAARFSPGGFYAVGAINDGLHLLTAGYWIGGLCALAAMLAQRGSAPRLGLAISVFAEWGMIAVALLIMTGMINALMVLLGSPGHDSTSYLLVLGTKLVLVTAMIALALLNQFRLLPRLQKAENILRLRRNVGWELGLGLTVIGLAALLTLLPPTL
jgi:putative copper resistance protein D